VYRPYGYFLFLSLTFLACFVHEKAAPFGAAVIVVVVVRLHALVGADLASLIAGRSDCTPLLFEFELVPTLVVAPAAATRGNHVDLRIAQVGLVADDRSDVGFRPGVTGQRGQRGADGGRTGAKERYPLAEQVVALGLIAAWNNHERSADSGPTGR